MTDASQSCVYEVNIKVVAKRTDEYDAWLKAHVVKMQGPDGLGTSCRSVVVEGPTMGTHDGTPADAVSNIKTGDAVAVFKVTYGVSSRAALDDYLMNRAAAMRGDAAAFTGDFVAWRNIF